MRTRSASRSWDRDRDAPVETTADAVDAVDDAPPAKSVRCVHVQVTLNAVKLATVQLAPLQAWDASSQKVQSGALDGHVADTASGAAPSGGA